MASTWYACPMGACQTKNLSVAGLLVHMKKEHQECRCGWVGVSVRSHIAQLIRVSKSWNPSDPHWLTFEFEASPKEINLVLRGATKITKKVSDDS